MAPEIAYALCTPPITKSSTTTNPTVRILHSFVRFVLSGFISPSPSLSLVCASGKAVYDQWKFSTSEGAPGRSRSLVLYVFGGVIEAVPQCVHGQFKFVRDTKFVEDRG